MNIPARSHASRPTSVSRHGVDICGLTFRVRHRGRTYPPFRVEWADDLRGLELHHGGQKCGEICGPDQLHADFTGFAVPSRVREVAAVTFGVLVWAVREAVGEHRRTTLIADELSARGLSRFRVTGE